MSKHIENNLKKLQFWEENNPNISIEELPTHCFETKVINAHGLERAVSCGKCLGCVNRKKKYRVMRNQFDPTLKPS